MEHKFIYKLKRFEFWPWYAIYLPLLPIYLAGVIYTRRLLYFTAVNPGIDMGGFFGERKDEIQSILPPAYLVNSIIVKDPTLNNVREEMERVGIGFPVIAKPIVGERGNGVKRILNFEELEVYARQEPEFIIQEYIDFSLELGVLFVKMPDTGKVRVTSITEKEYLSVVGNGQDSVIQLLQNDERNRIYADLVEVEFSKVCATVPQKGEKFIVHRIGNHIKGTRFLNANRYLGDKMNEVFARVVNDIHGVYYGRFDLKVSSYEDLLEARNIKIFELNGVSAEPAHIYGLSNVLAAYKDLALHWIILIKIAKQNIKKGVKTTPFSYFLQKVSSHFS